MHFTHMPPKVNGDAALNAVSYRRGRARRNVARGPGAVNRPVDGSQARGSTPTSAAVQTPGRSAHHASWPAATTAGVAPSLQCERGAAVAGVPRWEYDAAFERRSPPGRASAWA